MTGRWSRVSHLAPVLVTVIWMLVNGLNVLTGPAVYASGVRDQPTSPSPILSPTATDTSTSTPTATPTPRPDLVAVSIISDPSPLVMGQPGTVTVEVRNTGAGASAATCWVGLYIDRAPVGDPNQQTFCPALGVGQSSAVLYTVALPDPGYHSFTAWVDFLAAIEEEDENNNQYSAYILVAQPTPTPTQTHTPVPTVTASPSASPTATLSPSPTSTPTVTRVPSQTATPLPGERVNLALNGDFEGPFVSHAQLGEIADGWTPFVQTGGVPQFLRAQERAKGNNSQRIWSDYVPFQAGMYQRVVGVVAGRVYTASAEVLSMYGEGDTPVAGMNMGKQVGIDPQGGDDSSSPSVIWSDMNWADRAWQDGDAALRVSAAAQTGVVTVFIRVHNVYGGHNDLFYVDNVALRAPEAPTLGTETPWPTATDTPLSVASATSPLLRSPTPTLIPALGTQAAGTPAGAASPVDGGGPALTPPSGSSESPRLVGRLVPVFFGLALIVIFVLVAAIMWLQQADE